MSNREDIMRRAVQLARTRGISTADGVAGLTASGGDAVSLVDAEGFFARGISVNLDRDTWLYIPTAAAADQVRLVRATDPIGQAYRHAGPDYGTPPTNERYLLLRDHPFRWNGALNEALRTMLFFPRLDEWTPTVTTQRIYTFGTTPLNAITDLTRKTQVFALHSHPTGDATNAGRWTDWGDGRRTWRVYDDGGTLRIEFDGGLPNTDRVMRFTNLIAHATVTADDTAMTVDEEWAALALLVVMGRQYGDLNNPDDEWTVILAERLPEYEDRRRAILAEFSYGTTGRHTQRAGAVSVAGRGGR